MLEEFTPHSSETAESTDEIVGSETATEKGTRATRVFSDISFPYAGLEEASSVARAMHDLGGVPVTKDQIAAAIDAATPISNSVFVGRLSAAQQFALVHKNERAYILTDLGSRIVSDDEAEAAAARVEAFQQPELYRKLIEHFRGQAGRLPGREGVENVIETLGVSAKQKDRARQVFERSALFAGFLNQARDRISMPVIRFAETTAPAPPKTETEPKVSSNSAQAPKPPAAAADDFLIRGLLDRMPPPDQPWSLNDRARWVRLLSASLAMMYGTSEEEELQITIPKRAAPLPQSQTTQPVSVPATPYNLPPLPTLPAVPPKPASKQPEAGPSTSDLDGEIPF